MKAQCPVDMKNKLFKAIESDEKKHGDYDDDQQLAVMLMHHLSRRLPGLFGQQAVPEKPESEKPSEEEFCSEEEIGFNP